METRAYYPLAKFGRVYLIPTPKGFMFYDKRTKTAAIDTTYIKIIYDDYKAKIKPRDEWELPSSKITIKRWACNIIATDDEQKKREKEIFKLMGYHYAELGRPKNFWAGLLNLDPRFKLYTIPKFKIDPQGSHFPPTVPTSIEETVKIIQRIRGEYLTEKLIYAPDNTPQVGPK